MIIKINMLALKSDKKQLKRQRNPKNHEKQDSQGSGGGQLAFQPKSTQIRRRYNKKRPERGLIFVDFRVAQGLGVHVTLGWVGGWVSTSQSLTASRRRRRLYRNRQPHRYWPSWLTGPSTPTCWGRTAPPRRWMPSPGCCSSVGSWCDTWQWRWLLPEKWA